MWLDYHFDITFCAIVFILTSLLILAELTGSRSVGFAELDLEGDFDPKKYDEMMQKAFSDDYYQQEEMEKPEFSDEDTGGTCAYVFVSSVNGIYQILFLKASTDLFSIILLCDIIANQLA